MGKAGGRGERLGILDLLAVCFARLQRRWLLLLIVVCKLFQIVDASELLLTQKFSPNFRVRIELLFGVSREKP